MLKLYSKKSSIDVTIGEVRKRDKKKEKDPSASSSSSATAAAAVTSAEPVQANYEATLQRFKQLSYYDQHALTNQCTSKTMRHRCRYNRCGCLVAQQNFSFD